MIDLQHGAFQFYMPVEFAKGSDRASDDNRRLIKGLASTARIDLQNENVLQDGMMLDYFRKSGWINDDHQKVKVGYPTSAEIAKSTTTEGAPVVGLAIEGQLLDGEFGHTGGCVCPPCRSDYWWSFMRALEKSNAPRKIGFSVEGKVLRRTANTIAKAWIRNVAITDSPINVDTWAEITKGLGALPWCDGDGGPQCGCEGCRVGVEATRKSALDGLSYEEAVQSFENRNWNPVASRVMARALTRLC